MESVPPDDQLRTLLGSLPTGGGGVRALEVLAVLRKDVLTQSAGARRLREAGGLDRLVVLLRRGSERVQDAVLSALATCCLEDESCLAIGKLNILVPLVSIVKTSARDSVVGRACRLLGNLAQKTCNAENLHTAGAVAALMALLERRDKNMSYPTLIMLVRAIRLLWMVPEKREDMLIAGVVRAIAILLTMECESAGLIKTLNNDTPQQDIRKSQEELLMGLLKCLGYFTTLSSVQCAEQLQGEGRGYQCLVALTRLHETMALKCLMNLCYVTSCRPLLGTAGLVECLVGILQKQSDVEWWPEGSARALAQLSEESVNRCRLRHCGGLTLLLTAAKASHHALKSLLQYVWDDSAFQILIDEGLVNFLCDELTSYLPTMAYEHELMPDDEKPNESPTKDVAETEESPSAIKSDGEKKATNCDELNVVIERDNMIVGFVDNASDAEEMAATELSSKRKRNRNKQALKCQLSRMASQDWSANIYWEPKSPDGGRQLSSPPWSPERALSSPPWSEGGCSPGGSAGLAGQCKRARWDASPDSGLGVASPSWCGWSDVSPSSPLSVSSEDSESELYSPVCSESESEEESGGGGEAGAGADEAELGAAHVAQELDDLMMDDDDADHAQLDDNKEETPTSASASRIGCVLVLWLRVAHGATADEGQTYATDHLIGVLTRKECLFALVDYMERCRRPYGRAAKILARILSNSLSLMAILRSGVAMKLYKMTVNSKHSPDRCKQCRQVMRISKTLVAQVSTLAESDYGIGEICYTLYKGPLSLRHVMCSTLPYFVRTLKALRQYFVQCSGLNMLISMLAETEDSKEDYIIALTKLAINLKIRDPKSVEKGFKDHMQVSYNVQHDTQTAQDIVTFELDDSATVTANKSFLCENSEVFCAMLTGQFKESAQKCVRLQKATKDGLEYMLSLLHCGLNEADCDIRTFPLAERLETSLEVLVLTDRFLLRRMRSHLRSAIVQFQLTASNVQDIYVWSQNDGMLELWTEAVCYVLVGDMTDAERVAAFTAVLQLEYKQQWLNDVKALIMQHASPEFREAYTAR